MWRGSMNRSVIRNLVVVALIAYPAFAFGQDQAPDVKGKWIGKTHTILVGKGGHWPKGRGTWDQPALLAKDLAFDIRGQDGRRFWGVTTISGGGEKTDEPFIGELTGKDYKSFVFADTDGFWNGHSTAATCSRSATCIPTAGPLWSAARRSSECADARQLAFMKRHLGPCPLCAQSGLLRRGKRYCYSITSSARASTVPGMVMPSSFAVARLMKSSNFVGCS